MVGRPRQRLAGSVKGDGTVARRGGLSKGGPPRLPRIDLRQKTSERHRAWYHHVIVTDFVPRYQSHADAAKARGRADEEAVCLYMVEHEKSQVEFARRELAGASLGQSLAPLVRFLKYPIQR